MNNQKGFVNIALVVLVIVLAGALGYVTLLKKPVPVEQSQSNNSQNTEPTTPPEIKNSPATVRIIDWNSLIPSMRTVLKQAFPNEGIEDMHSIGVYKKVDITSDGISEALVNLGTGGATTGFLTLMRIENNKPVVALFKQKDGKVSHLIFSAGSGGSGRYGSTVEMLENKNAVYSAGYSKYGESTDSCLVEAYKWNSQTKIFEYNANLSNEIQQTYCQTAGTGL